MFILMLLSLTDSGPDHTHRNLPRLHDDGQMCAKYGNKGGLTDAQGKYTLQ